MKTITLILPDYYDKAITITAIGQRQIKKNCTATNVQTAAMPVENGQIIDLNKIFFGKESTK